MAQHLHASEFGLSKQIVLSYTTHLLLAKTFTCLRVKSMIRHDLAMYGWTVECQSPFYCMDSNRLHTRWAFEKSKFTPKDSNLQTTAAQNKSHTAWQVLALRSLTASQ